MKKNAIARLKTFQKNLIPTLQDVHEYMLPKQSHPELVKAKAPHQSSRNPTAKK